MSLLDLLLPASCAGCGRPGPVCCDGCRGELVRAPRLAWPDPTPPGLPSPWTVADYDGRARELILAYKERGRHGLRRVLGQALAAAVAAAAPPDALIVAVPSTPASVRTRGDDVVLQLARTAAGRHRVVPALRHRRNVRDSSGLSAAARARNLQGALGVRPAARTSVAGWPVVIVDDLITTGATLVEATRALREAGAVVVAAATVAATTRQHPRCLTVLRGR